MFYFFSAMLFFFVAFNYNIKYSILTLILFNIFFLIIKKKSLNDNKFLFHFCILLVFGSVSILFDNDNIIKFKTSFIYFFLSLFLLFSYIYENKVLKKYLINYNINFFDTNLNKIVLSFSLFFFILSILNIYIALNFSTKSWLIFKTFGFNFIFILFCLFIYFLFK